MRVYLCIRAVVSHCKKAEITSLTQGGDFSHQVMTSRPVFVSQSSPLWCLSCEPQWGTEPHSLAVWQWSQRFFCRPKHRAQFPGLHMVQKHLPQICRGKKRHALSHPKSKTFLLEVFTEVEKGETLDSSWQKVPTAPWCRPWRGHRREWRTWKVCKKLLKSTKNPWIDNGLSSILPPRQRV